MATWTVQRTDTEFAQQQALFNWRAAKVNAYPVLALLHASLNGVKLSKAAAGKARASGMTEGVWDVLLPAKSVRFHEGDIVHDEVSSPAGYRYSMLFIEMKWGKNKLTAHQIAFKQRVLDSGVWAKFVVCYSWFEAARVICEYLGIDDPKVLEELR